MILCYQVNIRLILLIIYDITLVPKEVRNNILHRNVAYYESRSNLIQDLKKIIFLNIDEM